MFILNYNCRMIVLVLFVSEYTSILWQTPTVLERCYYPDALSALENNTNNTKINVRPNKQKDCKLTLLCTCTYSNYNNSYSKYYEYKGNVISRIT